MGRKVKWTLNPRGKLWSEDDQKFGQKLLEKMGWSKGKGLGAKEDGNPDIIEVSYKNDSKGLGFKDHDDAWIEHQDDFNALLSSLNEEKTTEGFKVENSLEERSKKSKKRVHYHKFTRGKDISRCTSEDLSCILGKRKVDASLKKEEEEEENSENKETVSSDKSFGVVTVHNGNSIQDYFAKMMAAKAQKATSLSTFDSTSKNSNQQNREDMDKNCINDIASRIKVEANIDQESDPENIKQKNNVYYENLELNLQMNGKVLEDSEENTVSEIRSKKKKRKKYCFENYQFKETQLGCIIDDIGESADHNEINLKKKKKKKKKRSRQQ